MVAYLQAALEVGDPALLTAAFDDVERARAKLRGQPRYTQEELLAQSNPNAAYGLRSRLTINRHHGMQSHAWMHNR